MNKFWSIALKLSFALLLVYLASKFFIPELMFILAKAFLIISPFLIAIIVVLFLEPLVSLLEKRCRIKRGFASILVLVVILGGIIALSVWLVFRLTIELISFSQVLPQYIAPIQKFCQDVFEQGKFYYFKYPDIGVQLSDNFGSFSKQLSDFIYTSANSFASVVGGIPTFILGIIVTIIASYFLIKDRNKVVEFWLKIVPEPWGKRVLLVIKEAMSAIFSYLKAQMVLVSMTMIQAIIGFLIIGLENPFVMGAIVGLIDVIPIIGPIVIFLPWIIWAFISGNIILGIELSVLYLIIWLVRQFMEAKIVAVNLGLHPLPVLVSMYIGFQSFGVVGLAVGPILVIIALSTWKAIKAIKEKPE